MHGPHPPHLSGIPIQLLSPSSCQNKAEVGEMAGTAQQGHKGELGKKGCWETMSPSCLLRHNTEYVWWEVALEGAALRAIHAKYPAAHRALAVHMCEQGGTSSPVLLSLKHVNDKEQSQFPQKR